VLGNGKASMISHKTRRKALLVLHVCSLLGPLPFTAERHNWDIRTEIPGWKRVAGGASFIGFAAHVGFKVCRLGQLLLLPQEEETPQYLVTLHLVLAVAGIMVTCWYHIHCIQQPELFAALYKMTLCGSSDCKCAL
jgi:hypothetical protein